MKLPALPTALELEFSIKTFVAAMLAMYFSMRIGLTSPYWAMTTVYIVSTIQAGTLRSKAVYRVLGTFISAIAALFLVPKLVNAPELLSLAVSLWVGICLFVSLLDRTPRSYVFMMSGYTVAIIGLPAVDMPQAIFTIALNRVEEITLGIVCATLVHTLVLPRSFGPSLLARLDRTLNDARAWIQEALTSDSPERVQHDRQQLAADLTEMRLLATHLPFDTSHLRWTTNAILALQDRLASVAPLISGIEDRLRTLRQLDTERGQDNLAPQWQILLKDIGDWLQAGRSAAAERAGELRDAIEAVTPEIHHDASWATLLKINLAMRLRSLVNATEESRKLRHHLSEGLQGARGPESLQYSGLSARVLDRDYRLAFLSGLAAAIAVGLSCAFWIITGWPAASGMPIMASVVASIYAVQDDPAPNMKAFMLAQIESIPISAFYLLFLIPSVHNFESLVIVTAPLFLVLGILISRPTTARRAVPILFGVTGALGLQSSSSLSNAVIPDVIAFINSILPQVTGMTLAVLIIRLMRSVNAEWVAHRVLRAGWRELAAMSSADKVPSTAEMSTRMLDRIAQLTPRLAAAGQDMDMSAFDAMRDLRVGLNMAQLVQIVRLRPLLANAISLQPLMHELSGHFRQQMQTESAPSATLLQRIDTTLHGVCVAEGFEGQREAAAALVGIRRDLFPHAHDYSAPEAQS